MLSQLMVLFGFFALVLVAIYWVNRAVILFDRLIADGHSAGVFLEFTALWLPSVIAQVLPMASFAAAVYVTNRMMGDSEMTVVQSTGYSPWRLARPVLAFGLMITVMMSILTHVLMPASLEQLRLREQEASGSVTARLLREGAFQHPAEGVTFYTRGISAEGELRDVLLSDRRVEGRNVIFTAERAYLVSDDEGSKLVMLAGMAQTLDVAEQRLSTTNFTNLTYDISTLLIPPAKKRRKIEYISTLELLTRTAAVAEEVNDRPGEVLEEAHMRFEGPLLCLVAALIGFSALMVGGYSRFGVTKQIVFAIFLMMSVKVVEGAVTDPVRGNPALWPLTYLPSVLGGLVATTLLWRAARPFRPRRAALPEAEAPA
ncbi:LPS export ABC transporter permease LptF [Pseudoponticoccus marisrubri]|uniref:LPS export ABC transporter permease LptF n=1 Tax=Pseudoponticoccus marisrubri TaxID=1685382 RepID=A0A0W7WMY6_9RHOB|nr:LPS export ABC transporter permease LptF [Pseudoponticoccus marisrubri]KUF11955.1 LPS export ABC transporter permease LptF [Pseudoponticoccus marisrubri]